MTEAKPATVRVRRRAGHQVEFLLERGRRNSYAGLVYFILLLITFVPASITLISSDYWSLAVKILAVSITLGAAALTFRSATAQNFSFAWTMFWTWTYVFFGLAQSYQLANRTFPWGGTFGENTVLFAQVIIFIGCIALHSVATFTLKRRQAAEYAAVGTVGQDTSERARRWLLVLSYSYSAIAVAFIAITGPALFQGKANFQAQLVANGDIPGSGTLFFISTAGAIVVPAVAIVCRKNGVGLSLTPIIISTALAFIVTNPLTGSRFLTGSFLIAVVAALLIGRPLLRLMPAGIAGALVTVFPSLDVLRGDGTGSSGIVFSTPSQSLVTFDFDAFEMLLRELTVAGNILDDLPSAMDLLVAPLVRWVPILSDLVQGNSGGRVVAESTGMSYTNVSLPLWAEAHLVAGIPGVIAAFAALGLVLAMIRQPVVIDALTPSAVPTRLAIDASVGALIIIVLRGSLYEVLGYLLFALVIAGTIWAASRSGGRVASVSIKMTEGSSPARTIAFYLPQFHAIPENDEWWGEGFTEWTNVQRAEPQFTNHDHPRRPGEIGQYDLSDVKVMHAQAALAAEFGVDAFCFYFYWFGGKRLLERPLENYLEDGPDFPFCISWANESWTRRWDGKDKESLIAQDYSSHAAEDVFDTFLPYLRDSRYLRVDGAAVIMVHRVDHLPVDDNFAEIWRARALQAGVGPLHLVAAETKPGISPEQFDFDAAAEFPPVGSNTLGAAKLRPVQGLSKAFKGRLMSYPRLMRRFMSRVDPGFVRYRGVVPSWDNTARRRESSTIYVDSSPEQYRRWLSHARAYEDALRGSDGLVFINAWNEWAEGAYLEPDTTNGRGYLEATRRLPHHINLPQITQQVGMVSLPWLRSLALATVGSALQSARRMRWAVLGAASSVLAMRRRRKTKRIT